jgi:hypothetical protein
MFVVMELTKAAVGVTQSALPWRAENIQVTIHTIIMRHQNEQPIGTIIFNIIIMPKAVLNI